MPIFFRFRSSIKNASLKILDNAFRLFAFNEGPYTGLSTFNVIGYINTRNGSAAEYPDVEIFHPCFLRGTPDLAAFLAVFNMADPARSTLIAKNNDFDIVFAILSICRPKSRGSVTCVSSNIEDSPIIDLNMLGDDEDVETLVRACKIQESFTETEAYRKYGGELQQVPVPACDGYEYRSDPYWRCYVRQFTTSTNHPIATCSMNAKKANGVVDDRLRVHGIRNLRVVDASVIPLLPSANINPAVVMVAERGAHLIKNDWRWNERKFY